MEKIPTQPTADEWCVHALLDEQPVAVTYKDQQGRTLNLCKGCQTEEIDSN